MPNPHLIAPVQGLEFGAACPDPANGLTPAKIFDPSLASPSATPFVFPGDLAEGSGERVEFGICCRNSLTLNMTFDLNPNEDAPTGNWIVRRIDKNGTSVVWNSTSATITEGGTVAVTFSLDIGPCGAVVQIDASSTAGSPNALMEINPVL